MLLAPFEAVMLTALLALVVDALVGEPRWLYRHMAHPVVWIGRWIEILERWLWREDASPARRRAAGRRLVAATLLPCAVVGGLLTWTSTNGAWAAAFVGVLASSLLAQRSLSEHVRAVADGLAVDLDAGRAAVSQVVGRDPTVLDASGVARAAIESAAENVSDGVTAPFLWLVLLGPLGLVVYKGINTLDSMVGYRSERYLDFGRAAARLDDWANWLPARLTGILLLMVTSGPRHLARLPVEARKHRSPNAGWPEAAMAFALDARLAGPRVYASGVVDDDWIGDGRAEVGADDVRRAVAVLWRLWWVLAVLVALAVVIGRG